MAISSLRTKATWPATPGALALATRDLDRAREHLSAVFADHRLTMNGRAGRIDFRHYHAPLGRVSFNGLGYGASVTVGAPALSDFYLLQFTLRGVCDIACGSRAVRLLPGSILVMNPTQPYEKHWSADCRQLIIRIERDFIHGQLAAALGRSPERPLEFALAPLAGRGRGVTLSRFAELICRDLDRERLVARPEVQRSTAETLCSLLLGTLEHSYREALDHPAEPPVPRFIRRADDFIRAHLDADVTPAAIAEAAGVSARTLHRGFRSFRNTTPMVHLKSLRMAAARQALLDGQGASVTDIASACGLWHLGKFARDYRRRFGERPSETLRRRRF